MDDQSDGAKQIFDKINDSLIILPDQGFLFDG